MADQSKPVSRPWRRFLRLQRTGADCSRAGDRWVARLDCAEARIQREAVAVIEKAGGTVSYDWEWNKGNEITGGKPWAPRWLVDLVGVHYFGHVTAVRLDHHGGVPDAAIVNAVRLTRVQTLSIYSSTLSDAGLAHLGGLTNLSELYLFDAQVTDAGLIHLRGLTNLSALYLGGIKVTDAGLVHLIGLNKLSDLSLFDAEITDAGLARLSGLTNLRKLSLEATGITDRGLAHVNGLPDLSKLNISFTHVTDAGFGAFEADDQS